VLQHPEYRPETLAGAGGRGAGGSCEGHDEGGVNVADAIATFCWNLEASLPLGALLDRDAFRSQHCYTEPIDRVLRKYEPMLRQLFATYAAIGNHGLNDVTRLSSTSRLSVGEFLEMIHNVGLVELGLLSATMCMEAFTMSRLRCSSSYLPADELKLRQLLIEDFLEALVRLSYVVALPTDEEVEEAGAIDAGDFLAALHADAEEKFRQFVVRRTGDLLGRPRQPLHKCVDGMLSLMVRLIQANAPGSGGGGANLSRVQLSLFARHRHGGAPLRLPTASFDGSSIVSVIQEVEMHNTQVLSGVPAFSALASAQIDVLREAMSVAKFNAGEYVFEQGAAGDAFYLVTSGCADVFHIDPDDTKQEEQCIAHLSESDCFGELALLRNEPRSASVVATSTLDVLFITRGEFERHLGSLSDFQLHDYHGEHVVHAEESSAAMDGQVEAQWLREI